VLAWRLAMDWEIGNECGRQRSGGKAEEQDEEVMRRDSIREALRGARWRARAARPWVSLVPDMLARGYCSRWYDVESGCCYCCLLIFWTMMSFVSLGAGNSGIDIRRGNGRKEATPCSDKSSQPI
jgi:hypothetical protein